MKLLITSDMDDSNCLLFLTGAESGRNLISAIWSDGNFEYNTGILDSDIYL